MSGHTKGLALPWVVFPDGLSGSPRDFYVADAEGNTIASGIRSEAHAHLICAAANHFPALLALVEQYAGRCECGGNGKLTRGQAFVFPNEKSKYVTVDCPYCADLRQVLAAVREGQS